MLWPASQNMHSQAWLGGSGEHGETGYSWAGSALRRCRVSGSVDYMTDDAASVLQEALALPEGERASIAAELLASLPEPRGALAIDSPEWVQEMERRARGVLSGETVTEGWGAVEGRVLDRLSDG